MKSILIFSSILFLLSSCAPTRMIQVFDTATTNTKLVDSNWVFENDTVKITYAFWVSKGVMSFSVYNKLDKPIYIDWKNSSFIINSIKYNYWIDEQKISLASYYGGYYYSGPLIKAGYTVNEGVQISAANEVKPERITFIPPKSFYYRSSFYLQTKLFELDPKVKNRVTVPNYLNPKKTDTIIQESFTFSDSPFKFRNYLAFSLSETSQDFLFVDNEFYLSSIKDMEYQTFLGIPIKWNDGKPVGYGKSLYQHQTSFYIRFNKSHSETMF